MNQLEFTVNGNHLSLSTEDVSTGGSVNYDQCVFTFDDEWTDFERTAVFETGRDSYRVALDENDSCFIPSPCVEKEGIIRIGVFGTNDDTVITTNSVAHHIEEGLDELGEWFEEDYSLVLNAVSNMENRVTECLNGLNESFDAIMRSVRKSGAVEEVVSVSDCPDDWYLPEEFSDSETVREIRDGNDIQDYLGYRFEALREDFPTYVKREVIGTDASEQYPVYAYVFEPLNYEKTVLVTSCVHGTESMALFALSDFCNELCRRSDEDRTLAYIRNRVKLVIIPAVNPYGVENRKVRNSENVDIGINFPYRWDDCEISSKGSSAADQVETQNIIDFAEILYADKLCAAVDFHVDSYTAAGKNIFYPRFKDNCLRALTEFVNRFNFEAEDGTKTKGILAASLSPTLSNYLADTYGINSCEAVWPDELYGGMYSDANYTKFKEFIGNLLYTVAKNSSFTCRCGAQPFIKYIAWKSSDDAFAVPQSSVPSVMGISNYSLSLSSPCILNLQGFVVLNVVSPCTVKIKPLLYQMNSPEQDYSQRSLDTTFMLELSLESGIHVIPVSSVLQAYYTSYNPSVHVCYCEDVTAALAVCASAASAVTVDAYTLTLSGIPSDMGKPVEISTPIGASSDYSAVDIPTQQMVYPLESYTENDEQFED